MSHFNWDMYLKNLNKRHSVKNTEETARDELIFVSMCKNCGCMMMGPFGSGRVIHNEKKCTGILRQK